MLQRQKYDRTNKLSQLGNSTAEISDIRNSVSFAACLLARMFTRKP
jgi:hypothetical protein